MVWCVSLHSDLQRINESISCRLCSLTSLCSSVKCKMWVCGSDCSLLSSTLTFDLVFSHSITAVTNTTDAAQVPQPLKVQSFHETLVYWVTSTPFKLLSNITALTKFVLIAHFVSSLHTREGPCSCSMWLYPVPHVTRGNAAPLSSGIHPGRDGETGSSYCLDLSVTGALRSVVQQPSGQTTGHHMHSGFGICRDPHTPCLCFLFRIIHLSSRGEKNNPRNKIK